MPGNQGNQIAVVEAFVNGVAVDDRTTYQIVKLTAVQNCTVGDNGEVDIDANSVRMIRFRAGDWWNADPLIKFIGLCIQDDTDDLNGKEWGTPVFGSTEVTDGYKKRHVVSTVSTKVPPGLDKNTHSFSLIYYDMRHKLLFVYDPMIRNEGGDGGG